MKKKFENPELEIVVFDYEEIIVTSGEGGFGNTSENGDDLGNS